MGWALAVDLPASTSLRPAPYKQQVHPSDPMSTVVKIPLMICDAWVGNNRCYKLLYDILVGENSVWRYLEV